MAPTPAGHGDGDDMDPLAFMRPMYTSTTASIVMSTSPKVYSVGHLPERRGDGVSCCISRQVEALPKAHAAVARIQAGHWWLQAESIMSVTPSSRLQGRWQQRPCTEVQPARSCHRCATLQCQIARSLDCRLAPAADRHGLVRPGSQTASLVQSTRVAQEIPLDFCHLFSQTGSCCR